MCEWEAGSSLRGRESARQVEGAVSFACSVGGMEDESIFVDMPTLGTYLPNLPSYCINLDPRWRRLDHDTAMQSIHIHSDVVVSQQQPHGFTVTSLSVILSTGKSRVNGEQVNRQPGCWDQQAPPH